MLRALPLLFFLVLAVHAEPPRTTFSLPKPPPMPEGSERRFTLPPPPQMPEGSEPSNTLPPTPEMPEGSELPVFETQNTLAKIRELSAIESEAANADASIRILGDCLEYPDKMTFLRFVEDLRNSLEARLGIQGASIEASKAVSFRGNHFRLLLRAKLSELPEDREVPRLSSRLTPYTKGQLRPALDITLENPLELTDPHPLADTIVEGFLKLKVLQYRPANAAVLPTPPPRWFSLGMARALDPAMRQADFDRSRDLWFSGKLPPLSKLTEQGALLPDASPAVAVQLVEYWLSFPQIPERLELLCASLAKGCKWTPVLFILTSSSFTPERTEIPAKLSLAERDKANHAFNAWLYNRQSRILTVGTTTPERIRRTLISLQLFAGENGVPEDFTPSPAPLQRLFLPENATWAPAAAEQIRIQLLKNSVGHGDEFRAACDDIASLLYLLSQKDAPKDAIDKLNQALNTLRLSPTK